MNTFETYQDATKQIKKELNQHLSKQNLTSVNLPNVQKRFGSEMKNKIPTKAVLMHNESTSRSIEVSPKANDYQDNQNEE